MALVAVVGATGTGKSDFAIALARRIAQSGRSAEIVNADAMQLYRGMDIGTAKVPPAVRREIPHHLLDVLDVTDEASVARYQEDARRIIADLQRRDTVPILVGGSGLYVSATIHDLRFPGTDPDVRARLEAELERDGVDTFRQRLAEHDPEAAELIDVANTRRLIRALEVIELTGEPASARLPAEPVLWQPVEIVHLQTPRLHLVQRLDDRVERMWNDGLIDEVRGLIPAGIERGPTASRAIGYAQAISEIRGAMRREEAIEQTQRRTRAYARRQVSWFRRYRDATTIDSTDDGAIHAELQRLAHVD